jgi:hypothetical protein
MSIGSTVASAVAVSLGAALAAAAVDDAVLHPASMDAAIESVSSFWNSLFMVLPPHSFLMNFLSLLRFARRQCGF